MAKSRFTMETRSLTEGAIMAALTAVLAIIYLYIPILGVLVSFIWTIPVVAVSVRHDLRVGILTMTAAALIIMMIATPLAALSLIIPFAAPALLLGYAFQRRWNTGKTLITTAMVTFISMIAALILGFLLTGISPWQQWINLKESLISSVDMMMPLYENSGALKRMGITALQFNEQWINTMELMELLIPALLVISAAISAFINYVFAYKILIKLKINLPAIKAFHYWRLPWWHIWGFTSAFALAFLGSRFIPQYPIISNIGINILFVYVPIFVGSGLTIASFYIHRVPKERRLFYKIMLFISFFLLMNGFVLVMGTIGLFDTVFDYRRIEKKDK